MPYLQIQRRSLKLFAPAFMLLWLPSLLPAQFVGFNNSNPLGPLSLRNGLGTKVLLWGPDAPQSHYGFGNINNDFRFHSDASFAHIGFGTGRSAAFSEVMRINNTTGHVGIGTTNPTQVLDINGSFRLSPYDSIGPNPYYLQYKSPSWLYLADADNATTPVRIGSYAYVAGFSFQYYSYFGFFRHSDGKLLLGTNPAGALLINGNTGTAGQVLRSDDYYGEAKWRTSSSEESYNLSAIGIEPGAAYLLSNTVQEISLIRPGEVNTVTGYTFQLTYPSKMVVRFQAQASVNTCCGPSVYDVQVVVNGNALRTFRFAIENAGNKHSGASTMFTLNPGSYQIKLRAYRVSGPNVNITAAGANSPIEAAVTVIPNPYY